MPITTIHWKKQSIELEYILLNPELRDKPLMVFLHEGLGSIALWRDFPEKLCTEFGIRGLVYSRPAYGWSSPRTEDEKWHNDFMHQQALEVLPKLLARLSITEPIWLLGHSDGGSIALLAAAYQPHTINGIIVLAPHILVENLTLTSIEKAKDQYLYADLKKKLAKFHQNVDSAFWGWNDVWLSQDFKSWNIVQEISKIQCPVLAMQGFEDPYGTMAQIEGIKEVVAQTELTKISDCGHSPHREQPIIVLKEIKDFLVRNNVLN